MINDRKLTIVAAVLTSVLLLTACAPSNRYNLVTDPDTGLQFGSRVSNTILLDSSLFEDNSLRLRLRNVSGDEAFNLRGMQTQLEDRYSEKGYAVSADRENAILVDIVVTHSGQITKSYESQFALAAAGAGGIAGTQVGRDAALGAAGGVVAGTALGAIVGSYTRDNTYVITANVTIAIFGERTTSRNKSITFNDGESTKKEKGNLVRPIKTRIGTRITVYAGGRNAYQRDIVDQVHTRFQSILSDVL